jgi:hypothetical protein
MVIPMAADSASPAAAVTDAAKRDAILASARAPAEKELASPVKLGEPQVTAQGEWAFVLAKIEGTDGRPFDYARSPRAEEAKRGLVSHRYAALLRKNGDEWVVVEDRVGPTDPAWLGWSAQYHAPEALFAIED